MTNAAHRIDVHHHAVVAPWSDEIEASAPGGTVRPWSPAAALRAMDHAGVERSILSITAPGVHFGDDVRARRVARATNEALAEIVAREPDRFGFFASLPAPDADGSIDELAYAQDQLGCSGVTLLSNSLGVYPGEERLRPLWEALDARRAVVFLHPNWMPGQPVTDLAAAISDFLAETVRAAISLIFNGVMQDRPDVKVILPHAGGFLPYSIYRVAGLIGTMGGIGRTPADIVADARRFYFDTALSTSPSALPALLAFADPTRVLFGSDWPYATDEAVDYFLGLYGDHPLTKEQRAAVDRGNAAALFGP